MTPQTFMFIGRSGCGKGTQAALLIVVSVVLDLVKKIEAQITMWEY